ncbi:type-1 restriction enzyme mjaxp r protein [Actinidia rufa]|uniref:Type-1 restriction enzyme mjaxp r protein n=1 Tax=Actinidia rufa TaxID=165716 RepID=A0A7J0FUT0_9ERIC|nr:type-1 restriction enzyme mjaxp r protein [Actinidia rufa]
MEGRTVTEPWFSNLWRTSRKSTVSQPNNKVIGILVFEVTSLMSKVVKLWQCLSDEQIVRLKEEIVHSIGIRKLVSEDGDYVMDLALAEIIQNLGYIAKSIARLGKSCTDPVYHSLEHIFDDPIESNLTWYGWEYRLKKVERKVKKMQRFVAVTAQLYQELEVLAGLEQSLRRMLHDVDSSQVKLHEFQQKVMWQRQEVKNIRDMSPWVRTYDYTVRLLLRSLFTIVGRIKSVFGIKRLTSTEYNHNYKNMNADRLVCSHSISVCNYNVVHSSEKSLSRIRSGPLGRSASNLGLSVDKFKSKTQCEETPLLKTRGLARVAPFMGCMTGGSESPFLQRSVSLRETDAFSNDVDKAQDCNSMPFSCSNRIPTKDSLFISKRKLLNAHPSTLGGAALALHFANIIILIEKLVSYPYLIGLDGRDDLYDMLPTSVRALLRIKLKLFSKTAASSAYDAALATKWRLTIARILEWLAPLAHNMKRWYSERNIEKQCTGTGTNVLLVQTLHFADRVKTEAAILELVMGLNYISRFVKETNGKALIESHGRRACDGHLFQRDNIIFDV